MQEKIHSLEAAKSDLVMNVKNSTAFLEKLMLG